jgi:FkbM family methyltransferase
MLNLALNKPARQSSTSPWSSSPNPEIDAKIANNGIISDEQFFHTGSEKNPWWQVDLLLDYLIQKIVIFNRKVAAERLKKFSVLTSLNGTSWRCVFKKNDAYVFGKDDDQPYTIDLADDCLARLVRIRLDGQSHLHFSQCQIFGVKPGPAERARLKRAYAAEELARAAIPPGRAGFLQDIDDLSVFIDTDGYDPGIVSALKNGFYEGKERHLAKEILQAGDRVIEAGTALGLVSMTAARIVGADKVFTFDANPHIVADARENFRRNEVSGITSHIGILKNRQAIKSQSETVDFYISKAFWASRLSIESRSDDIIDTVKVPVFCLEEQIKTHAANVFICDIEGGEIDLLMNADLTGIRAIIMETHYWAAGETATDNMMRKLIMDGFAIHLGHASPHVIVLRRDI